jgi:hypothetical protein
VRTSRRAGVVTFLFADIEGSTRRWETDADPQIRAAVGRHLAPSYSTPTTETRCNGAQNICTLSETDDWRLLVLRGLKFSACHPKNFGGDFHQKHIWWSTSPELS